MYFGAGLRDWQREPPPPGRVRDARARSPPAGRPGPGHQERWLRVHRGIHALYQRGAGRLVLRSLGIEPQGSSPPLARYQALPTASCTSCRRAPIRCDAPLSSSEGQGGAGRAPRAAAPAASATAARASVSQWIASAAWRGRGRRRCAAPPDTYVSDMNTLATYAAVAQLLRAAAGFCTCTVAGPADYPAGRPLPGAHRDLGHRRRVRRWPGRVGHEQRSAGRTVGDHRGRPPGGSPQAAAR